VPLFVAAVPCRARRADSFQDSTDHRPAGHRRARGTARRGRYRRRHSSRLYRGSALRPLADQPGCTPPPRPRLRRQPC
jgi:hypothetical protein